MNYFTHNDSKGRDARVRAATHTAERAKARDFDGTLYMSKYEVRARCREAALYGLGMVRK